MERYGDMGASDLGEPHGALRIETLSIHLNVKGGMTYEIGMHIALIREEKTTKPRVYCTSSPLYGRWANQTFDMVWSTATTVSV
jgi:hypothetical protein